MGRHQGHLLVCILLVSMVSVLVRNVTCKSKGPNVKRMSSSCRCHNNIGRCAMEKCGNRCQCPEGFDGRWCQFDCRKSSENECKKLLEWDICSKHRGWMEACCKETCKGIKNTCLDANPLKCKSWKSHGECIRNPLYMRTCCGMCFGNPKCENKKGKKPV